MRGLGSGSGDRHAAVGNTNAPIPPVTQSAVDFRTFTSSFSLFRGCLFVESSSTSSDVVGGAP